MPALPFCAYSSVAVDGMGALWVACPTSPSLLRVIDANTSSPFVAFVNPRSGIWLDGSLPYFVVVHTLTQAAFNVMGHRVVRAGATDIIHTIPVLQPDMPPVVTAFIATNTACLPSTPATPTTSASAIISATASMSATASAPTTPTMATAMASPAGTPILTPMASPIVSPVCTSSPTATTSVLMGTGEGAQVDDDEQYPVWVLALVGAALAVGGFSTVIGGAALVQRCLNVGGGGGGGIGGGKRTKVLDGAAAAAKVVWVTHPPASHVNPMVTAAAPYRSGGGQPSRAAAMRAAPPSVTSVTPASK